MKVIFKIISENIDSYVGMCNIFLHLFMTIMI